MTGGLNRPMANLSGPERERLGATFAADPELADELDRRCGAKSASER